MTNNDLKTLSSPEQHSHIIHWLIYLDIDIDSDEIVNVCVDATDCKALIVSEKLWLLHLMPIASPHIPFIKCFRLWLEVGKCTIMTMTLIIFCLTHLTIFKTKSSRFVLKIRAENVLYKRHEDSIWVYLLIINNA